MAATGTGRTHLLLGQVDPATSPAAAAAELYVLSGGYGQSVGETDVTCLVESPTIAPLGMLGRLRLRLVSCPVQYDAACTVRVTPIVDEMIDLPPVTVTLAAPGALTRTAVQVKLLRPCTLVRVRVEVLERAGLVEVYTPTLYYAVLSRESAMAMGEAP